jgi:tungstate transport system substrate-binding protein
MPDDFDRRALLKLGCATAAATALSGCTKKEAKPESVAAAPLVQVDSSVVRVASVPTAVEGDLLPTLVSEFERQSHLRVSLTATEGVYDMARDGKVDLAISHYGHKHAEAFVMDGFGEFPRTLFSNQMALVGPPSDPARVRGLTDVGEAFRRIAAAKSPFVVNGLDGVRYLVDVLWNAAGRPDREGWLFDEGRRKDDAIRAASDRGAYAFWGLTPFLRLDRASHLNLEPLVLADPLLQRMLVSIVVRPTKTPGVNEEGARTLQSFLLSPATQARIREVCYPGATAVYWVPAGRHNRTGILPRG